MRSSFWTRLRTWLAAAGVATAMPIAFAATVPVTSNITTSETWTADNEYILTQPIYVTNGATLTIEPGTVVRGEGESAAGANDPGALIVSRGSKINAYGNEDAPVVFTDLLDDNIGASAGTGQYQNGLTALGLTGRWGGLVVLGRTYVANNTLSGPNAAREVQIEGLTAAGGLGFYGNGGDDDDDSGTLSYVSIRYGGFNLSANNEINGLTLGAVGRQTNIHHVEVFQNKDDGVEFFGGTVGVQHIVAANGGDDGIDYDEGFRGKGQFILVMQGTPGSDRSDKGGELDGGNGPDGSQPYAVPAFYNATFVGLGGNKAFTNAGLNTALHFRDNAGGRWYNSAFLDFGGAPACFEGDSTDADSSGARFHTPITRGQCSNGANPPTFCDTNAECGAGTCVFYYSDAGSTRQLELEDNEFWCVAGSVPSNAAQATAVGCDNTDHCGPADAPACNLFAAGLDNGSSSCLDPLPIQALDRLVAAPTVPDPVAFIDPRPAPGSDLLATNRTPPADGFFKPAGYKGAFSESTNWAARWTNMARLGYFPPSGQTIQITADIDTSETWTADNEYVLTEPIYVTNGATLTIEPGTVIRGEGESSAGANDPGTLVIARGSKIQAHGTVDAPIVFTDLDDDNLGDSTGTGAYANRLTAASLTGRWGGLVVLGRTYVANNTLTGPLAAREVQIEGLTAAGSLGFYGNGGDDDDDSGAITYTSIRYGGFNLSANNEINGLTLGAVGRATDLDYVEVIQNKDDGIEFFGGTVGIKHAIVANVGDDGVDFDEGYRGKGQFIFVMQGLPGTDKSDKGSEQDGGNAPDGSQPYGIAEFYNATFVGLGGNKAYTNSLQNTALHYRDNAGYRWYNSAFLDFGGAPACIEGDSTDADSSGARFFTPIRNGQCAGGGNPPTFCNSNADCIGSGTQTCEFFYTGLAAGSTNQLELQDNTFWCFGGSVPSNAAQATAVGCDNTDHCGAADAPACDIFAGGLDNGTGPLSCASALPISDLTRRANVPTLPDVVDTIDPRPAAGSPLLTTNRTPPVDGFYTAAPYRGAFSSSTNWAKGWSTLDRLGYFGKPKVVINSNVTSSTTWNASNDYVLGQPIYVTNGATLTIEPGTVVRGEGESSAGANDPGTLVVTRGSKIRALGTVDAPVVFTNLNDSNVPGGVPLPPYDNKLTAASITGTWGGVVVLGRTYVANNTATGPSAAREVQIEGLTAAGSLGFYGNGGDDDDDSGSMSYASIRYGGFNLSANNEINGLTLGAVGRETDIDHIEVFNNKDDGFEWFGGTVETKYLIAANGGDDGVDFDEGYRGQSQFVFVMQGTPGTDRSDKGSEQDGSNAPDASQPYGLAQIYNATFVGLGGNKAYTNSLQNTALHMRDNAGYAWFNSAFLDFGGAPVCIEGDSTDADSSGARFHTPISLGQCQGGGNPPTFCNTNAQCVGIGPQICDFYYSDVALGRTNQLELEDNLFWCFGGTQPSNAAQATAVGCDNTDHCGPTDAPDCNIFDAGLDNGTGPGACGSAVPVRSLRRMAAAPTLPDPIMAIDPRPATGSGLLTTNRVPPANGFLWDANFKGAFNPGENWARGWTALDALGYFPNCSVDDPNSIPNPARNLDWPAGTTSILTWVTPLGDDTARYDVIRQRGFSSDAAGDFSAGAGAVCVESNDTSDTRAVDKDSPDSGECFYYLIRAENDCGGSLHTDSSGTAATVRNCP